MGSLFEPKTDKVSGPTAAAVTHYTLDCHVPSRMGQICAHNQPIGRGIIDAEDTEYNRYYDSSGNV